MRVFECVSVTWEMFGASIHAFSLEPLQQSHGELRHAHRITRERAIANHRIVPIGIHVDHRRKIEIEADRPKLAPELRAHGLRNRLAPLGDFSHRWKLGERRTQTLNTTAFLINADDERRVAQRLELTNQRVCLLWRFDVATKKNDATHAQIAHQQTRGVAGVGMRNTGDD